MAAAAAFLAALAAMAAWITAAPTSAAPAACCKTVEIIREVQTKTTARKFVCANHAKKNKVHTWAAAPCRVVPRGKTTASRSRITVQLAQVSLLGTLGVKHWPNGEKEWGKGRKRKEMT